MSKKNEFCGGNACPSCGKCIDWHYKGNLSVDHNLYKHNESHDICNPQRWYRNPNATCLVYTNALIYSTGNINAIICHCPSE